MTNALRRLLVTTAFAALAACSSGNDGADDNARPEDPGTPVASVEDPGPTTPDGYLPQDATVGAPIPDEGTIPAAMQGRWGLVAADCEPGRADAKGLLEIGGTTLTYYESRGTLDSVSQAGADEMRASFDFTGEGMNWERDMRFTLQDGGAMLVSRQYEGGAAVDQPLTYSKCP